MAGEARAILSDVSHPLYAEHELLNQDLGKGYRLFHDFTCPDSFQYIAGLYKSCRYEGCATDEENFQEDNHSVFSMMINLSCIITV